MIPKNLFRKILGWVIFVSQILTFTPTAFYFLRSPTDIAAESIMKAIILGGLFLLFAVVLIFVILVIYQAIFKRDKFGGELTPLVIESSK
jgi:hypothetical protein